MDDEQRNKLNSIVQEKVNTLKEQAGYTGQTESANAGLSQEEKAHNFLEKAEQYHAEAEEKLASLNKENETLKNDIATTSSSTTDSSSTDTSSTTESSTDSSKEKSDADTVEGIADKYKKSVGKEESEDDTPAGAKEIHRKNMEKWERDDSKWRVDAGNGDERNQLDENGQHYWQDRIEEREDGTYVTPGFFVQMEDTHNRENALIDVLENDTTFKDEDTMLSLEQEAINVNYSWKESKNYYQEEYDAFKDEYSKAYATSSEDDKKALDAKLSNYQEVIDYIDSHIESSGEVFKALVDRNNLFDSADDDKKWDVEAYANDPAKYEAYEGMTPAQLEAKLAITKNQIKEIEDRELYNISDPAMAAADAERLGPLKEEVKILEGYGKDDPNSLINQATAYQETLRKFAQDHNDELDLSRDYMLVKDENGVHTYTTDNWKALYAKTQDELNALDPSSPTYETDKKRLETIKNLAIDRQGETSIYQDFENKWKDASIEEMAAGISAILYGSSTEEPEKAEAAVPEVKGSGRTKAEIQKEMQEIEADIVHAGPEEMDRYNQLQAELQELETAEVVEGQKEEAATAEKELRDLDHLDMYELKWLNDKITEKQNAAYQAEYEKQYKGQDARAIYADSAEALNSALNTVLVTSDAVTNVATGLARAAAGYGNGIPAFEQSVALYKDAMAQANAEAQESIGQLAYNYAAAKKGMEISLKSRSDYAENVELGRKEVGDIATLRTALENAKSSEDKRKILASVNITGEDADEVLKWITSTNFDTRYLTPSFENLDKDKQPKSAYSFDDKLAYFSEDEVNNYYYLWKTEGAASAMQYALDVNNMLNSEYKDLIRENRANVIAYDAANDKGKFIIDAAVAGIYTGFMEMTAPIDFATTGSQIAALGKTITAPTYSIAETADLITNIYTQTIGDAARAAGASDFLASLATWGYGVYTSTIRSVETQFVGGGIASMLGTAVGTAANQAVAGMVSDLTFMGSAAMSSYRDFTSRGVDVNTAWTASVLAGVAEAAFEHLSFDKLYNAKHVTHWADWGDWVRNLLISAGIEGSEEVFTSMANFFTETGLLGPNSTYWMDVENYRLNFGLSRDDAMRKAFGDTVKSWAVDFAAGAASGGLSVGGRSFIEYKGVRSVSKQMAKDIGARINRVDTVESEDTLGKKLGEYYDSYEFFSGEDSGKPTKWQQEDAAKVKDLAAKAKEGKATDDELGQLLYTAKNLDRNAYDAFILENLDEWMQVCGNDSAMAAREAMAALVGEDGVEAVQKALVENPDAFIADPFEAGLREALGNKISNNEIADIEKGLKLVLTGSVNRNESQIRDIIRTTFKNKDVQAYVTKYLSDMAKSYGQKTGLYGLLKGGTQRKTAPLWVTANQSETFTGSFEDTLVGIWSNTKKVKDYTVNIIQGNLKQRDLDKEHGNNESSIRKARVINDGISKFRSDEDTITINGKDYTRAEFIKQVKNGTNPLDGESFHNGKISVEQANTFFDNVLRHSVSPDAVFDDPRLKRMIGASGKMVRQAEWEAKQGTQTTGGKANAESGNAAKAASNPSGGPATVAGSGSSGAAVQSDTGGTGGDQKAGRSFTGKSRKNAEKLTDKLGATVKGDYVLDTDGLTAEDIRAIDGLSDALKDQIITMLDNGVGRIVVTAGEMYNRDGNMINGVADRVNGKFCIALNVWQMANVPESLALNLATLSLQHEYIHYMLKLMPKGLKRAFLNTAIETAFKGRKDLYQALFKAAALSGYAKGYGKVVDGKVELTADLITRIDEELISDLYGNMLAYKFDVGENLEQFCQEASRDLRELVDTVGLIQYAKDQNQKNEHTIKARLEISDFKKNSRLAFGTKAGQELELPYTAEELAGKMEKFTKDLQSLTNAEFEQLEKMYDTFEFEAGSRARQEFDAAKLAVVAEHERRAQNKVKEERVAVNNETVETEDDFKAVENALMKLKDKESFYFNYKDRQYVVQVDESKELGTPYKIGLTRNGQLWSTVPVGEAATAREAVEFIRARHTEDTAENTTEQQEELTPEEQKAREYMDFLKAHQALGTDEDTLKSWMSATMDYQLEAISKLEAKDDLEKKIIEAAKKEIERRAAEDAEVASEENAAQTEESTTEGATAETEQTEPATETTEETPAIDTRGASELSTDEIVERIKTLETEYLNDSNKTEEQKALAREAIQVLQREYEDRKNQPTQEQQAEEQPKKKKGKRKKGAEKSESKEKIYVDAELETEENLRASNTNGKFVKNRSWGNKITNPVDDQPITRAEFVKRVTEGYPEMDDIGYPTQMTIAEANDTFDEWRYDEEHPGDQAYSILYNVVDENGKVYDKVALLNKVLPNKILGNSKAFNEFVQDNLAGVELGTVSDYGISETIEFANKDDEITKSGFTRPVLSELTYGHGRNNQKRLVYLNAEDVVGVSTFRRYKERDTDESITHEWLDQNGFEVRTGYVMTNNKLYPVRLFIAQAADGRSILYFADVEKSKAVAVDAEATARNNPDVDLTRTSRFESPHDTATAEDTIPQEDEEVKLDIADITGDSPMAEAFRKALAERQAEYPGEEEVEKIERQYSLAGEQAKQADLGKLETAMDLETLGETPENIWIQTGWFRGVDGKWRWEIYDKDFTIPDYIIMRESVRLDPDKRYNLDQFLTNADALFDNYPTLRDIIVYFTDFDDNTLGEQDPKNNTIALSYKLLEPKSLQEAKLSVKDTLMHEIQHAIQDIEGFAKGSNPGFWKQQKMLGWDIENPYTRAKMAVSAWTASPDTREGYEILEDLYNAREAKRKYPAVLDVPDLSECSLVELSHLLMLYQGAKPNTQPAFDVVIPEEVFTQANNLLTHLYEEAGLVLEQFEDKLYHEDVEKLSSLMSLLESHFNDEMAADDYYNLFKAVEAYHALWSKLDLPLKGWGDHILHSNHDQMENTLRRAWLLQASIEDGTIANPDDYIVVRGIRGGVTERENLERWLIGVLKDYNDKAQIGSEYKDKLKYAVQEIGLPWVADYLNARSLVDIGEKNNHLSDDSFTMYRNTAGEIEARDVSDRMDMDEETRARTMPIVDEDAIFNTVDGLGKAGSTAQYSLALSRGEIEAIQNIGQKSVNDFNSSDIQATNKLAEMYWNEMNIKSPFFRAWFGDWRENDKTRVQEVKKKDDRKGVHRNKDTGWDINVSYMVTKETREHHDSSDEAALPYLPYIGKIVESAILLDTSSLKNPKSENSLLMHSLYAIVNTGKGPEVLKLYVEEMNDPNKQRTAKRSYQLQNIEKYRTARQSSQKLASSGSASSSGSFYTVADLFAYVKAIDKNFNPLPASKVVDEDGKPLVVYHGTDADFTVFDRTKGRSNMDIQGSFFSPWREDAEGYGPKVGAYYLNIKHPAPEKIAYQILNKFKGQNEAGVKAREYLERLGYDGVNNSNEEYIAFNPEQIKSAETNRGTFDKRNPDYQYSIIANPAAVFDAFGDEATLPSYDLTDLTRSDLSDNLYYSSDGNTAYYQTPTGETVVLNNVGTDSPEARYINYLEAMNNANDTDTTTAEPYTIPPAARNEANGYNLGEQDAGLRRGQEEVPETLQEGTLRRAGSTAERNGESGPQSEEAQGVNESYSYFFGRDFLNGSGDTDLIITDENDNFIAAGSEYDATTQDLFRAFRDGTVKDIEDAINDLFKKRSGEELNDAYQELLDIINNDDNLTDAQKEERRKAAEEAVKKYGGFKAKKGDKNPQNRGLIPKKTDKNTKTRSFVATAAANTTDELAGKLAQDTMTNELLGYTPQSNKSTMDKAETMLESQFKGSLDAAASYIRAKVEAGEMPTAVDIALAEILITEYSNDKSDPAGLAKAAQVTADISILGTNGGQFIQAMTMIKNATPKGQLYYLNGVINQLNRMYSGRIQNKKMSPVKLNDALVMQLLASTTREEMNKVIERIKDDLADQIPATVSDRWNAWRYLAMLGNPRTHIRNIFGNAMFVPAVMLKDLIATTLEQNAKWVDPSARVHKLGAGFNTKSEYWKYAANDYKAMKDVLKGKKTGNKYSDANDIISRRKVFKDIPIIGQALQKANDANSTALEAEDTGFQWFYYVHYLSEFLQAKGVKEADLGKLASTKDGKALLNQGRAWAVQQAQRDTYHQANALATAVNKLKHTNSKFYTIVDGVVPFVGTPSNIMILGAIDYTPIGLVKGAMELNKLIKAGDTTHTTQAIDKMAAGLSGTAIMALGFAFRALGFLRGLGPDDDDLRELEAQQGHQNWAVEIGDYSYTIDWMAPASLPLFTGVTFYDVLSGTLDMHNPETLYSAALGMANPMFALSMLDGLESVLTDLRKANNGAEAIAIFIGSALASYAAQAVPTLGGQIARTIDPVRRDSVYIDKNSKVPAALQTFIQKSVQAKTPGWSSKRTAYIDRWGREEREDNYVKSALLNFLSPGYLKKINEDPVDAELVRLYKEIGGDEAGDVIPKTLKKSISNLVLGKDDNGEEIIVPGKDLTAKEYEELRRVTGQTRHQILMDIFNDELYKNATANEKLEMVSNAFAYGLDVAKRDIIPERGLSKDWMKVAEKIGPADYILIKQDYEDNKSNEKLFTWLANNPNLTESQVATLIADKFNPPDSVSSVASEGFLYDLTGQDEDIIKEINAQIVEDGLRELYASEEYKNAPDKNVMLREFYENARAKTLEVYGEILDHFDRVKYVGKAASIGAESFDMVLGLTKADVKGNYNSDIEAQASWLGFKYKADTSIKNPLHEGFSIELDKTQRSRLESRFRERWNEAYDELVHSDQFRNAESREYQNNMVASEFSKIAAEVEGAYAAELYQAGGYSETFGKAGSYKWTDAYAIADKELSTARERAEWLADKYSPGSSLDDPDDLGYKLPLSKADRDQVEKEFTSAYVPRYIAMVSDPDFIAADPITQEYKKEELRKDIAKSVEAAYVRKLKAGGFVEPIYDSTASLAKKYEYLASNDLSDKEKIQILKDSYVGGTIANAEARAYRKNLYDAYLDDPANTKKYLDMNTADGYEDLRDAADKYAGDLTKQKYVPAGKKRTFGNITDYDLYEVYSVADDPIKSTPPVDFGAATKSTSSSSSLLKPGNIDLDSRPVLRNSNGSYSTVDSVTWEVDGEYINVPTVIYVEGETIDGEYISSDWVHVDADTALDHYFETGEHLGIYKDAESADKAAKQLHYDQAKQYDSIARKGTYVIPPKK